MSTLLTLSFWYGTGFLAAATMIRRGHQPVPWIFAAWIGGALCIVAALAWAIARKLGPTSAARSDRTP